MGLPQKPDSEAEQRARTDRALALRVAGMSYEAIADLEVAEGGKQRTAAEVAADVQHALEDRHQPISRELNVALEIERLDGLHRAAEATLRAAQSGRCGACGRGGDPDQVMAAADRLLRIAERRAKLLGLDAKPQRDEQAGNGSENWLAELRSTRR